MRKFLFFLIIFFITLQGAFAQSPIKISDFIFDNSDGIIYLKTDGIIDENVTFAKGYLKEPDRIYLDINNAVLIGQKKSYTGKYSVFNNIKVSQFTVEPKTVRVVFEYNNKLDLSQFQVFTSNNAIYILTKKNLVQNTKFKTVYSNSKTKDRAVFYQGSQMNKSNVLQAADLILSDTSPKNEITMELTNSNNFLKIPSGYYADSVTKTNKGVMINGIGKLSLYPSFFLENPNRLIIDLDDTVVNPDIRNKTYIIGNIQTENAQASIEERETVKIGQNSQNVARIVVQGKNAKDYRAVISPDSKNLYLTNKSNIITAKMSDNNAELKAAKKVNLKGEEIISLLFSDSVAFSIFEENSNLYLDINNLEMYQDNVIEPLTMAIPGVQFIRTALDKLRIVLPSYSEKSISLKTSPDNDEIRIYSKPLIKEEITKTKPAPVLVPAIITQKKPQAQISNLFTVVIDAGHGGSDVGATRNNIYEKDITLKIAKMVEKNLNQKKVKTFMVRDKDKTVSLNERSDFSNEKKPDLFVSIHVNSSLNDEIKGIETHWWKDDSKKYAQYVHKEMSKNLKSWNTIDRGLFKSQFYVINHTEAPAILCEIGFISNKNERDEITKAKRQEEIAKAISDGVYNYLKAKK